MAIQFSTLITEFQAPHLSLDRRVLKKLLSSGWSNGNVSFAMQMVIEEQFSGDKDKTWPSMLKVAALTESFSPILRLIFGGKITLLLLQVCGQMGVMAINFKLG